MKRFWDKVDKSGDCWEWTAGKDRYGYGQFKLYDHGSGKQKVVGAHKLAWKLERGDWAIYLCHTCDNRACVNPDHLYEGDDKTNGADRRARPEEQRCKYGDDIIVAMRYDYAEGLSGNQIFIKYNASKATVLAILNGKIRPGVGGPIRDPDFRYHKSRRVKRPPQKVSKCK